MASHGSSVPPVRHPNARPARPRRASAALGLGLGLALLVSACTNNPVTGRNQLMLVGSTQGAQMGAQAYQEILSESQVLPKSHRFSRQVEAITRRLVTANGLGDAATWEINALQDDTPNAFALPGGKVGVNTGLAQVARTPAQMATVIAHELAHVTSHHGEERMSQQILVGTGASLAGGLTGSPQAAGLLAQAATLGVILPYSRTHEAEADEIGLFYMARAGFDPREAVTLWQNMARAGGAAPPEFLSTHPSDQTRIQTLQRLMPQALALYEQSDKVPAGRGAKTGRGGQTLRQGGATATDANSLTPRQQRRLLRQQQRAQ